jgi:hypothetical protein
MFDVQVITQVADADTGHVPVPPVRDFNDLHW